VSTFEYRKLLRANILLKVLYKTRSWPLLEGIAYSKNVGATGINIIMDDKIDKNTDLELRIFFPEHDNPVYVKGKLIWQCRCSYVPESKKQYFSCGIQFSDMSPEDAIRTSDFIRDLLKNRSDAEVRKIVEIIENIKHPKPPAGSV